MIVGDKRLLHWCCKNPPFLAFLTSRRLIKNYDVSRGRNVFFRFKQLKKGSCDLACLYVEVSCPRLEVITATLVLITIMSRGPINSNGRFERSWCLPSPRTRVFVGLIDSEIKALRSFEGRPG